MPNPTSPFVRATPDPQIHAFISAEPVAETRRQDAIGLLKQVIEPILNQNIVSLGMVRNLSYLICGCCGERTSTFGRGGGEQMAQKLGVPLLGQVSLDSKKLLGWRHGTTTPPGRQHNTFITSFSTDCSRDKPDFLPNIV